MICEWINMGSFVELADDLVELLEGKGLVGGSGDVAGASSR